ncbi:hypothetical protein [Dactylosporangium sp. CA-139066]|uniref:hypothetical protein n=1 Tax=Dactylosporangium sp. CA-139066 TaxID=3239930 RepID=UPI003D928766
MESRQVAAAGAAAVLLPASGFLPWWSVRVRVDDRYVTYAYSAWSISTWWTAAVAVATLAVAAWLACRLLLGRVPRVAHLLVLAALAASLFLVIDGRRRAEPWPATTERAELIVGELGQYPPEQDTRRRAEQAAREIADGWSRRDHLHAYHADGLEADAGWGLWAGVALLTASAAALTIAWPPRRPPP